MAQTVGISVLRPARIDINIWDDGPCADRGLGSASHAIFIDVGASRALLASVAAVAENVDKPV